MPPSTCSATSSQYFQLPTTLAFMSTATVTVGAKSSVKTILPLLSKSPFSKMGVCNPFSPPSPIRYHRTVLLTFISKSARLHLHIGSRSTRINVHEICALQLGIRNKWCSFNGNCWLERLNTIPYVPGYNEYVCTILQIFNYHGLPCGYKLRVAHASFSIFWG